MAVAVFIDKDGTLVKDVPYNIDPAKISLQLGAGPALRRLQKAGYKLIVVSNQSGVARGFFPLEALTAVNQRIQELLEPYDVAVDDFYYCPHGPEDGCACRKPQPGLLLRAAEDYLVDVQRSWMIGDILHDVEAGNHAGCRTIHLDNGNETEWTRGAWRRPDVTVTNLEAAAEVICGAHERRHRETAVPFHY
jgi:histidinol-phosphate phosphatase family protein